MTRSQPIQRNLWPLDTASPREFCPEIQQVKSFGITEGVHCGTAQRPAYRLPRGAQVRQSGCSQGGPTSIKHPVNSISTTAFKASYRS